MMMTDDTSNQIYIKICLKKYFTDILDGWCQFCALNIIHVKINFCTIKKNKKKTAKNNLHIRLHLVI